MTEFENTKSWGPFFWTLGPHSKRFMLPMSAGWVRELGKGWHFGWGVRLLGERCTHTIGIWWRDKHHEVLPPKFAALIHDTNEDEEDWVAPLPEKERKSARWTWSMLKADREMRRPEMNLVQYIWYHWQGKKLAKQATKILAEQDKRYDEWVKKVIRGEP